MIAPAVIDALLAAGATAEIIAAAVKADQALDEAKHRERLAKDAARKREERARRRMSEDVQGRARTSVDALSPPSAPPSPPSLNNPSPSSPTPSPTLAAKRARAWPDGWEPDRDFARRQGWSEERIDGELARFHDHALAKNSRYSDWPAAWRNWCRSPFQKGANNGRSRTLADAADDLITRAENFQREGGPVIDHEPC